MSGESRLLWKSTQTVAKRHQRKLVQHEMTSKVARDRKKTQSEATTSFILSRSYVRGVRGTMSHNALILYI